MTTPPVLKIGVCVQTTPKRSSGWGSIARDAMFSFVVIAAFWAVFLF